jgi:hypothetical protein
MKLRHAVPLGVNENPASYTSRIAALYELSAREFCLDWSLRFQSVVDGNAEAIAKIAQLGGVDPAALAAHAFVRGEKHSCTYRGERLVRPVLSRLRVRVCPRCLQEDIGARPDLAPHLAAYNRGPWAIEAVKTCPRHNLGLVAVSIDPAPNSMHDFVQHVSPALGRLDRLIKKAPRRRPSGLETYVLARLAGEHISPFLDGLELHAAIKTAEMIGAVAVFGRTPNLRRLSDDDWWRAGAAGFEIAAAGVPAIGGFLTGLQRSYRYGRGGNEGPQAMFGRLFQWLEFGAEHPAYDPVRAVVGRHIGDRLPVGPGDVVFGVPVAERRLHSIRTLSVQTGMHPKRLGKLLRAARIVDGDQTTLADNIVTFDAKAAAAVVSRAKGAMSLPAAGEYLNAPRMHRRLLAEQGFIRPCVPAAEFSANDQYAQADLDEFLRRLHDGAHAVGKPKPGQRSIPAAAKHACCSAANIIRLVLDKKLGWVGHLIGADGYLAVLVDVDEIRAKTRGPEHGGVTQCEMTELLCTSDGVVHALMKAKNLKTFIARDPINHCPAVLIRADDAKRFQQKFVSLFALAKERGKHFKAVKNELDAAGVEPAFKPKKIGATFYRRRDVRVDNVDVV